MHVMPMLMMMPVFQSEGELVRRDLLYTILSSECSRISLYVGYVRVCLRLSHISTV